VKFKYARQQSTCIRRDALFYCVELFDGQGLTAIQFFDGQDLESAKCAAIGAIQSGAADIARILDDQARMVFRPASRAPATVVTI
jgi:hypothetical protein